MGCAASSVDGWLAPAAEKAVGARHSATPLESSRRDSHGGSIVGHDPRQTPDGIEKSQDKYLLASRGTDDAAVLHTDDFCGDGDDSELTLHEKLERMTAAERPMSADGNDTGRKCEPNVVITFIQRKVQTWEAEKACSEHEVDYLELARIQSRPTHKLVHRCSDWLREVREHATGTINDQTPPSRMDDEGKRLSESRHWSLVSGPLTSSCTTTTHHKEDVTAVVALSSKWGPLSDAESIEGGPLTKSGVTLHLSTPDHPSALQNVN